MKKPSTANSQIAENRKARHNYAIEDTFECGIVLVGSEVKSLRAHQVGFADSYVFIKNGEVFILGLRIEPFKQATHDPIDPERTRKLLLHKKEITRLERTMQHRQISLVPLKIYLKEGRIKILVGIGTGKSKIDKRDTIKERDTKKELARVLKRG
jgi:SsrA-binding protein